MRLYYTYILASKKDGVLYIGLTSNLERRIYEHKNSLIDGFTKKYKVKNLVYYQEFQSVEDAIKEEKRLKNWKRQWKIDLIEKVNPDWKDLYYEII